MSAAAAPPPALAAPPPPPPPAPKKTTSFLTDVLAGSLGGIAGRVIEYPFDTLKVQLQTAYSGGASAGRTTRACALRALAS